MLQDGIVTRYLDAHCAEQKLKLCPYRHELPRDADDFLWSGGVFDRLGRFSGLGEEMRAVVLGSLVEYPAQQIEAALADTAEQLVMDSSVLLPDRYGSYVGPVNPLEGTELVTLRFIRGSLV
jgi:hypothetical protein